MDSYHGIIRKTDEPHQRTTVFIPEAESLSHATQIVQAQMPSDYEIAWLRRRQDAGWRPDDRNERGQK